MPLLPLRPAGTVIGAALLALVLAAAAPALVAQTTSEWSAIWAAKSNNVLDFSTDIATAGRGDYLMTTRREVLHSSDGGVSWRSVLFNDQPVGTYLTHVAHPVAGRMIAVSDSTAYRPDGESRHATMYVSLDGGATWVRHLIATPGVIGDISMYDGDHGVACMDVSYASTDSLLRTTDGGATWRSIALPADAHNPLEVDCLGPQSWAVRAFGDDGSTIHLFRTDDAGATWRRSTSLRGIRSITFVDALHAFAAGTNYPQPGSTDLYRDLIMSSTDGGLSWTTVLDTALESAWGLYDIAFADSNNGIAGGGIGKIYRTTDGGATWIRELPPSDQLFESMFVRHLAYPVADEAIGISERSAIAYRGARTLVAPLVTEPVWASSAQPLETTIRWTAVEGATSYDVQIGDTVYWFDHVEHAYFNEPYLVRTGLTDTSLAAVFREHTLYIIRVRARNDSQTGDWSRRLTYRTVGDERVVQAPRITQPANGATGLPLELDMTWTAVEDAAGYPFRIALESSFLLTHVDVENHQDTTARLTELRPETRYYARVRARDSLGEMSAWSIAVFTTGDISAAPFDATIALAASLRPNIATDHADVWLMLPRASEVRIAVLSTSGESVIANPTLDLEAGEHTLPVDVSTLPSGRYLVRVDAGGTEIAMPLVVVR